MTESTAWMERVRKRRAFADPELDRINEETIHHNLQKSLLPNLWQNMAGNRHQYPENSQQFQEIMSGNSLNVNNTNPLLQKSDTIIAKPVLKFSIDAILGKS